MNIQSAILSRSFATVAKAATAGIFSFALTAGSAFADNIGIDWSAGLSGSLIGLSTGNVDEDVIYSATFLVPAPLFQSTSGHGVEHHYLRTEITGFEFKFNFPIPETLASFGNYGKLTAPVSKSHGFTGAQLLDIMPLSDKILSVTAIGRHIYAVPEPETYLLVFCGLGVLGWRSIKVLHKNS
ncbi:hypothetical protein [Aquabacterium sp.]|uniref:hypothetical protein n=1 Tax=Aquabacterium sp. TaxID=1872578 RepID=UPI003D6CB432